jgi:dsDNA-specific endonuclease/ATPase MutS2
MTDDLRLMTDDCHVPVEHEIDLHAFAPADIASVVEEYVEAAAAAGFREVRLIHGRGRGIQRGMVQAALDRHPRVVEFWDDTASHLGATIARLADPQRPGP